MDPVSTYVDSGVELEPDVRLLPGTILEGRTVIEMFVRRTSPVMALRGLLKPGTTSVTPLPLAYQ